MGFPMSTLTYDNMVTLMKVTLAIEVTYYIAVSLIKISILLMYMRFGKSNERLALFWILLTACSGRQVVPALDHRDHHLPHYFLCRVYRCHYEPMHATQQVVGPN